MGLALLLVLAGAIPLVLIRGGSPGSPEAQTSMAEPPPPPSDGYAVARAEPVPAPLPPPDPVTVPVFDTLPSPDPAPEAESMPGPEGVMEDEPSSTNSEWIKVVAGNYANLRASDSTDGAVLGMVTPGDTLDMEGGDRGWRQVRAGSLAGWVWVPALDLPGSR